MSRKSLNLDTALYDYLLDNSLREHPLLTELRRETGELPLARMQIAPEQGQFMSLLVRLTNAVRILEVGTFTGYSALSMAMALPAHGELIACDTSREWTDLARRYWQRAGVEERIDLRLGPAIDTLDQLLSEGRRGQFDLMFIDADKTSYQSYFERGLELVRQNGLILIDNVLWDGKVADTAVADDDTNALRSLNELLHHDERIDLSMLPLADGLTMARKR